MSLKIRAATIDDLKIYFDFLVKHSEESSKDAIIFRYSEEAWSASIKDFSIDKKNQWSKNLTEIGWERAWILTDEINIYGHLVLQHTPQMKANLHRAILNMGLSHSHRGNKFGSDLLETAIGWARSQKSLDWIQLSVFDHNHPAINLYKKMEFLEIGKITDAGRVFNQSINEILMTRKLN